MTQDTPIMVGIDPGVATGFAEWNRQTRKLERVTSMLLHDAWARVLELKAAGRLHSVTFEDARLRTGYFGPRAEFNQQGAGSVKRDCGAWSDFLGAHSIPFKTVSPRQKGAKFDAQAFTKVSGWTERTNEHGRDAAALVLGR